MGMAKFANRTPACIPVHTQTHTVTQSPLHSPVSSTICQSDKTGDGECLSHKDERNSTAEEQLSKNFAQLNSQNLRQPSGHLSPPGRREGGTAVQKNSCGVQDKRGRSAGWAACQMTGTKCFYHNPYWKSEIDESPRGLTPHPKIIIFKKKTISLNSIQSKIALSL